MIRRGARKPREEERRPNRRHGSNTSSAAPLPMGLMLMVVALLRAAVACSLRMPGLSSPLSSPYSRRPTPRALSGPGAAERVSARASEQPPPPSANVGGRSRRRRPPAGVSRVGFIMAAAAAAVALPSLAATGGASAQALLRLPPPIASASAFEIESGAEVGAVPTSPSKEGFDETIDDDDEWKRRLSEAQYYVLRQGGTEVRYSSVLVDEARPGVYRCAGCGSLLFDGAAKFESGTGWPSFAESTRNVQVVNSVLPPWVASAVGAGAAEIKCRTCQGHLGEVFYDGKTYPGTAAAATGRRYCVDGAALTFYPREPATDDGSMNAAAVRGDQPSDYAATLLD